MLEFEENRRLGLGHFVTRAEMAKQEGRKMSAIIGQFPGITLLTGPSGQAWVKSSRGTKSVFSPDCHPLEDAVPPACSKGCFARVWIDNAIVSPVDITNINRIDPAQIEAVEYYTGGAETPSKYAVLNSQCGVVVFHTRRPP